MLDFKKLKKASYVSRRMFVIKNICNSRDVKLEYLFGLFNLYNQKNRGSWFWQKATFSGALKETFDRFNSDIDLIVKDLKLEDEEYIIKKMRIEGNTLDDLLNKLEGSLEVDRQRDQSYVEGFLDDNFKMLIKDSLRHVE